MSAQTIVELQQNHLLNAALCLSDEPGPLLKRRAPLLEIVVSVVRPLDATKLVSKAALGNFRPDAQRGKLRACRPPQVMQREMRQPVLHARHGDIERIRAHVRHTIAMILPALRENVLASCANHLQHLEPFDHRRDQRYVQRLAGFGTRGG